MNQPPQKKKSSIGKIIGGCLGLLVLSCCCLTGLGGYVAYLDNRNIYTPGDEVSRMPYSPGGGAQQVITQFDGSGYAFSQIWLDFEGEQTGPDLLLKGEVRCDERGFPDEVDVMVWDQNRRVAGFSRTGSHVTAKVMLHDEYMRAGERPHPCSVTLHTEGGSITNGELVIRTYQRPSDRFAN